jgi:hypothetical protein
LFSFHPSYPLLCIPKSSHTIDPATASMVLDFSATSVRDDGCMRERVTLQPRSYISRHSEFAAYCHKSFVSHFRLEFYIYYIYNPYNQPIIFT